MRSIIRTIAFLLCAVLALSLCGCGDSAHDMAVYVDIGSEISTLDPQLAESSSDRIAVLNMFEGLLRIDSNGSIANGMITDYTVDGLTYTFNLRPDAKWNDETPLTADDFVFALRRAAAKDTNAPDFESIACIAGAKEVKNGGDSSALQVKAENKYTLKITLEYDDGNFLRTLTTPICMPCNENFFKSTNGKYGRDADSIISNGTYRIHSWNSYDYLIRLNRNDFYSGDADNIPRVVYITSDNDEERVEKLEKNSIDLAFVKNSQSEALEQNKFKINRYYNRLWFVVINKAGALGDSNVRRALSMAIHRNSIENNMPDYVKRLDAALPLDARWNDIPVYDTITSQGFFSYQPDEAYSLYSAVAAKLQSTSGLSILYPADSSLDSIVSDVAAGWQQTLGCFINMNTLNSSADVLYAVANANYTVAVCPVDTISQDPYDFLAKFKSGNLFGFENSEFDSTVNSLNKAEDTNQYISKLRTAQQLLFEDNAIIPLAATPIVICHSNRLSEVDFDITNQYINFGRIVKQG